MPVETDTAFIMLLATVTIAGIARGMSGFGTGMIVAPVTAAVLALPVTDHAMRSLFLSLAG